MKFKLIRMFSVASMMMALATAALAQEGGSGTKLGAVAVAVAAVGGALGDGKAISAACEGIARNPGARPGIFQSMILGLALIETLVLLAFIAAYLKL